jgi:hypothetical protein
MTVTSMSRAETTGTGTAIASSSASGTGGVSGSLRHRRLRQNTVMSKERQLFSCAEPTGLPDRHMAGEAFFLGVQP